MTAGETGYTRWDLPADIAVFAGDFASQPLAFAHLLDAAPTLDLTHVEVIQEPDPAPRLSPYFEPATIHALRAARGERDTLILILPAAYDAPDCPLTDTAHLVELGVHRGTVPRMVAT